MDPQHIATFNRVRASEYLAVEENCQKLNKYIADYEAVKSSLTSLSEKCKHPVMVPFGNVAFMSGSLMHTNDVLVLLGDNWFVEQSAKQTVDILGRRIAALQTQVDELQTRMQQIKTELSYAKGLAEESSDTVEIVEPYDEQVEQSWRTQHEANVRKSRKETKELNKESDVQEHTDYEQIWRRLEQLELEEEEEYNSENDKAEVQLSAESADQKPLCGPNVDSENLNEHSRALVINFKHSVTELKIRERYPTVCSPADIYDRFCVQCSPATSVTPSVVQSRTTRNMTSETADLESGSHVIVSDCADVQQTTDIRSPASDPAVRKVSKFKASRLKK